MQARAAGGARNFGGLERRMAALDAAQHAVLVREGLTIEAEHDPGYARPTGPAHHARPALHSAPPFDSLTETDALAPAAFPAERTLAVDVHHTLVGRPADGRPGPRALKCQRCQRAGHLSGDCLLSDGERKVP